jgi:hypothetical protein
MQLDGRKRRFTMKKKRDIFAELTEGLDALKSHREGKPAPPLSAPTNAHLKTGNKATQNPTPRRRC